MPQKWFEFSGPGDEIRDTFVYWIHDEDGAITYIGVTNSPGRRYRAHQRDGKIRDGYRMVQKTKMLRRKRAEKIEKRMLKQYRKKHGRNPRDNRTKSGRYGGALTRR